MPKTVGTRPFIWIRPGYEAREGIAYACQYTPLNNNYVKLDQHPSLLGTLDLDSC